MSVDIIEHDSKLKPMKGGAHLILSQDLLDFLQDTLAIVNDAYTAEQNEEDPKVIIKTLAMEHNFEFDQDSFGTKALRTTPFPVNEHGGELRVTVVLVKRTGVLNLDIRTWGTY
jgi:hypothetical protein